MQANRRRSSSRTRSRGQSNGSSRDSIDKTSVENHHDENKLMLDLHNKKRELESIKLEIQSKLETGLQELQFQFDESFDQLSDEIQVLFSNIDKNARPDKLKLQVKHSRKVFVPQNSLLSKMLDHEDENYKTIFNLFVSALILWGLSLALDDFSRSNGSYHYELLTWGLWRDMGSFIKFWIPMFLCSFMIIPLAHIAATSKRTGLHSNSMIYMAACIAYIGLAILFFVCSTYVVQSQSTIGGLFAVPLGIGFMCEQCRMSMKMHAYFREKLLWDKFSGKFSCAPRPGTTFLGALSLPATDYLAEEITKFNYFHFAPTLVYRDSYPQTRKVRISFVFLRLCEWCGIIYYAFCIFRAVLPNFEHLAEIGQPLNLIQFVKLCFRCMAPAMGCMLFTHFLILHVVQNIGAEVSRFADRSFYKDWWNSRTFSVFYRAWNGVVHDFIHSYVYSDLVEFLGVSKLTALLSSFMLSALVHEYILSIALGFFLPILGVLFSGPGLAFILLTKNQTNRIWNVFMWMMLTIGNASLMVLYCREYFARAKNIPPTDPWTGAPWKDVELDFWIPRTFRIQGAVWQH